MRKMI